MSRTLELNDSRREMEYFFAPPMENLLRIPNHFVALFTDFNILTNKIEQSSESETHWLDDGVVGSFGPSRLPPRAVIKLQGERAAVEKEISDLLAPHGAEPPVMVEVNLRDSRYSPIPKIRATLVVKRKSVGIYKDRLRARADSAQLNHAPFTSSPTVSRCGSKLVVTIAVLAGF